MNNEYTVFTQVCTLFTHKYVSLQIGSLHQTRSIFTNVLTDLTRSESTTVKKRKKLEDVPSRPKKAHTRLRLNSLQNNLAR